MRRDLTCVEFILLTELDPEEVNALCIPLNCTQRYLISVADIENSELAQFFGEATFSGLRKEKYLRTSLHWDSNCEDCLTRVQHSDGQNEAIMALSQKPIGQLRIPDVPNADAQVFTIPV